MPHLLLALSDPSAAPPVFTVAPFVVLLLAVAVLPLFPATHHWWESNRNKLIVSLVCGGVALAMLAATGAAGAWREALHHAAVDFVPFIILLGSLYIISGGILVKGSLKGTPAVNTFILGMGAVLANVLGTTGASMLLIRPLLRSNKARKHQVHTVVFFIFLVSNMGGMLLPIGDPPLFLGYLRGVPFLWTLNLWQVWTAACATTLFVYCVMDIVLSRRQAREAGTAAVGIAAAPEIEPTGVQLVGAMNFVWLIGVVCATAFLVPGKVIGGWTVPEGARELVMVACSVASMVCTRKDVRTENRFVFGPILEVAALFSGLFIAMQPALQLLSARGDELGATTPAQFFWLTGSLSSFLDNAPTYLVFANVGVVVTPQDGAHAASTVHYAGSVIDEHILEGISAGAVIMGAMTYIGNGPNLMVAAIARDAGVRVPSFFGYMLWSCVVLLPILVAITLAFF